MAKEVDERLTRLRAAMKKADGGKGVQAFIVPTEDPHMVLHACDDELPTSKCAIRADPCLAQSEYPPTHQARRQWISRFTGSAGTAVVTATEAALWTGGCTDRTHACKP